MIAIDEFKNQRLSMMVERVRNQEGDPRFFLAELREKSNNIVEMDDEASHRVIIHRLPWMRLDS